MKVANVKTKQLGVVIVETEENVSGNAFLGSSRIGANHFVLALIEFAKPVVMGQPAGHRPATLV